MISMNGEVYKCGTPERESEILFSIEFATPEDAAACELDFRLLGEYFVCNGKRIDPATVAIRSVE